MTDFVFFLENHNKGDLPLSRTGKGVVMLTAAVAVAKLQSLLSTSERQEAYRIVKRLLIENK